jgi:hypothetical protein
MQLKNLIKYTLLGILPIVFVIGCSTPTQRAQREFLEQQKIMEKIQPLGSSVKKLTKEESYAACDQKSEGFALEAEKNGRGETINRK